MTLRCEGLLPPHLLVLEYLNFQTLTIRVRQDLHTLRTIAKDGFGRIHTKQAVIMASKNFTNWSDECLCAGTWFG